MDYKYSAKSLSADLKFDNIYSTQYFAILMVRENVDSIIDRIRDFREAGAHFSSSIFYMEYIFHQHIFAKRSLIYIRD